MGKIMGGSQHNFEPTTAFTMAKTEPVLIETLGYKGSFSVHEMELQTDSHTNQQTDQHVTSLC